MCCLVKGRCFFDNQSYNWARFGKATICRPAGVNQTGSYFKKYHLNQLQALESRPKSATRLSRSSRIFKTIIKAIQEKKGEKIVSLDLRKIDEAVADFFIVCEATTSTQIKGIADHIQDQLKQECNESPFKHEGYQHAKWILVDYINVVVHVMQPETRRFYQLEELWSDAPVLEHDEV